MISATNTVKLTQSIENQAFLPSFTSLYNGSFSMPSIPYWLGLVKPNSELICNPFNSEGISNGFFVTVVITATTYK